MVEDVEMIGRATGGTARGSAGTARVPGHRWKIATGCGWAESYREHRGTGSWRSHRMVRRPGKGSIIEM